MKDWLVPPNVLALARGLVERRSLASIKPLLVEAAEWLVPAEWQTRLLAGGYRARGLDVRGNAALRNKHGDRQRCFVIGNGPSLGKMDLLPLRDELTIGANSFYMHPQADLVGLDYLCSGDHRFFVDQPKAIEWHRTIEQRLPNTTLMMHPNVLPLMKRYGLYSNHEMHVFQDGLKVRHPDQVRFDFTRPLNVGITSGSLLAIPLAIYLGVREIYLVGFDCNWLESYKTSYHFYQHHALWKEFDSAQTDEGRYELTLASTLKEFRAHDLIQKRAHALGVRVVNATTGGLLDAHPRMRYEDLF